MDIYGLMLGDYVEYHHRKFLVKELSMLDDNDVFGRVAIMGNMANFRKEITPIKLTCEILVKNGFLHRESDAWGEVYTYKWSIEQEDKALEYEHNFNLSPDPYEGTGFYWIPEMSAVPALCIKYVHELQNVMRMVGIKEAITL